MFSQLIELLRADGSIVVNKSLMRSIGLESAVVYSELLSKYSYWLNNNGLTEDGYFYSTIDDLEEATGLGRKVQDRAINKLVSLGLIKKKVAKYDTVSPKRYFKINQDTELIMSLLKNKGVKQEDNCNFDMSKRDKSKCAKDTNRNVQNGQMEMSEKNKSICSKGTSNNTKVNNTKEIILNNIIKDSISNLDSIGFNFDDVVVTTNRENHNRESTFSMVENFEASERASPNDNYAIKQIIQKGKELNIPIDESLAEHLLLESEKNFEVIFNAMEAAFMWAKGKEIRNWTGVLMTAIRKNLKPPPKLEIKVDKYEDIYQT